MFRSVLVKLKFVNCFMKHHFSDWEALENFRGKQKKKIEWEKNQHIEYLLLLSIIKWKKAFLFLEVKNTPSLICIPIERTFVIMLVQHCNTSQKMEN